MKKGSSGIISSSNLSWRESSLSKREGRTFEVLSLKSEVPTKRRGGVSPAEALTSDVDVGSPEDTIGKGGRRSPDSDIGGAVHSFVKCKAACSS